MITNSHSYIHPNAKIGKNVTIGPFSYIDEDVVIEDGTWIGANVNIFSGARIGKNCKIFPGAVISADPQDLKYNQEKTTVHIGEGTTIRECVTINKGTSHRMQTTIGKRCLIMAYCHIAHDCVVGDDCVFSNGTTLAGHVVVGKCVVMAGMSAAHQFCEIGDFAFVTGGSLVRKNVPPYIKVAREPLSYAGINSVGMVRKGITDEKRAEIQNIYRILFVENQNVKKALAIIEEKMPQTPERDYILEFVRKSSETRGIVKGYSSRATERE